MAVYSGPNPVAGPVLDVLSDRVSQYKQISARIDAAEGDRDKAVSAFMESSDNANAVKLRKAIEDATAKLRELADKSVVSETLDETAKEKLRKEMEEHKAKIKSGHDAVRSLVNTLEIDKEGVLKFLEEIGDPTRSNRGRKPGTAGSNLPRVSANVTLVSDAAPDKPVHFDSFSKAAAFIEAEVKDFQLAFAEAAGVDHMEIKTVDKPVEFQFKSPSGQVTYTVTTQPKPRQKPGPRTTSTSQDPQELPAAS